MTQSEVDPFAAQQHHHDGTPANGKVDYRIDGEALVLREPCHLPRMCILSGEESGLSDFEFELRVKPQWWSTAWPIVAVSLFLVGGRLFEPWSNTIGETDDSRFLNRIDLFVLTACAIVWTLFFSGMERFFTRKVRFQACLTEVGQFRTQQDLRRALVLATAGFAFAVGVIWAIVGWFPWEVIPVAALMIFLLVFAMNSAKRRPSSRLTAIQAKGGAIKVYGLAAEFIEKVRTSHD